MAGETDSEADDSEYEDEEDYIPPGHASVTWCGTPCTCASCPAAFLHALAGSGVAAAVGARTMVRSTGSQGCRASARGSLAPGDSACISVSEETPLCLSVEVCQSIDAA